MPKKYLLEENDYLWVVSPKEFDNQILRHVIDKVTEQAYWTQVNGVSGRFHIQVKSVDEKHGYVFTNPVDAANRFLELNK